MRTRLAAVRGLVVLIESVCSPEAPVAARLGARVLLPTLMELLLVTLPVILSLEPCLAGSAPVEVETTGTPSRLRACHLG